MAKDDKFTVMVSVLEGRFFPKRPSHKLLVQCSFNKVILSADPVPQDTANPVWDTELAWDLEVRALHFLRSQRSPIKLMCYSLPPQENDKKELLGYIVLDLRSTDSFPAKEKWMPLIQSKVSSKIRPEIKLAFGAGPQLLETNEILPPTSMAHPSPSSSILLASLSFSHPVSSLHLSPLQRSNLNSPLINVKKSLPTSANTASSPVPSPVPVTSHSLPLNPIASPSSKPLKLQLHEDGTYSLGLHPASVYQFSFTVVSLKDLHWLSVIPTSRSSTSGFYVFFQFFQHHLKTIPFANYKSPTFPEETIHIHIASNEEDIVSFFHSLRNLKIHLGFDDQLLAESIFSLNELADSMSQELHLKLPLIEKNIQLKDHPILEIKTLLRVLSALQSPSLLNDTNITPVHRKLKNDHNSPSSILSKYPTSKLVWHQYRFAIDIKAIRDLTLNAANVFIKYSYPAFGTPSPFISHPPIQVFKNIETPFHQAFSAYEFVMSATRLENYLTTVPLQLQLYHKDAFTKDELLGLAQLSLHPILNQPKKQVPDAIQKIQVLDQWIHFFTDISMKTAIATLRIVFSIEDFGVIEEQVGFEPNEVMNVSTEEASVPHVPPPSSLLRLSTQELPSSDPMNCEVKPTPAFPQSQIHPPQTSTSSSSTPPVIRPPPPFGSSPLLNSATQSLPTTSLQTHAAIENLWQQAQLQLEVWKQKQESFFLNELQKRDQVAMEQLEKKMLEKEATLEVKMQEFRVLEQQLEKLIADLELRETKLADAEQSLEHRHVEMEHSFQAKCMQVESLATNLAKEYQQKHQLESQLTQELQRQKADLIQERNEWEAKYRHLDSQFFEFKNKHTIPETEYQKKIVELTEKTAAIEKKMGIYQHQKTHFKTQWLKTLAEYAQYKKNMENTLQQSLQQKQLEIEQQQTTFKQIQQELLEIKSTQAQFKQSVLENKSLLRVKSPESTSPMVQQISSTLPVSSPSILTVPIQRPPSPVIDYKFQIQRLTEERDLLLKSGVYRPIDPLIRDINSKIEEYTRAAC